MGNVELIDGIRMKKCNVCKTWKPEDLVDGTICIRCFETRRK